MSRYLLGDRTEFLGGGNTAQHPIFDRAIEYTQVLFELD